MFLNSWSCSQAGNPNDTCQYFNDFLCLQGPLKSRGQFNTIVQRHTLDFSKVNQLLSRESSTARHLLSQTPKFTLFSILQNLKVDFRNPNVQVSRAHFLTRQLTLSRLGSIVYGGKNQTHNGKRILVEGTAPVQPQRQLMAHPILDSRPSMESSAVRRPGLYS